MEEHGQVDEGGMWCRDGGGGNQGQGEDWRNIVFRLEIGAQVE